jgi:hypothetical protein
MRTLAVLFALLCVLTTSCIPDAEPGKVSISDGAELNMAAELTDPPHGAGSRTG